MDNADAVMELSNQLLFDTDLILLNAGSVQSMLRITHPGIDLIEG